MRTEAECQHGQELQAMLFDGSGIASFASSSIGFITVGCSYPSEKEDLEKAVNLFKAIVRCVEQGSEVRSEIYDGRCRWLVDAYQQVSNDLLPSDSLKPQEVVAKLEKILAGEELPHEELDKLKEHLRTFTELLREVVEDSSHPQRSSYRGPRRCPVCRGDYKGGPDDCPRGCNPRQKKWVPLESRNSSGEEE
ncbi:MAG: hypothetical protein AAB632_02610 [Patescibacteria group bacterium]